MNLDKKGCNGCKPWIFRINNLNDFRRKVKQVEKIVFLQSN